LKRASENDYADKNSSAIFITSDVSQFADSAALDLVHNSDWLSFT